jgi:hypothetical protein
MPAVTVIQLRRGTAAQWTSANSTLAAGELGLETDTAKIKMGDGATAWTSLAYAAGGTSTVVSAANSTVTVGGTTSAPTVAVNPSNIPISSLGVPTAPVSFGSQQITGVADPTSAQMVSTKNYVDTVAQGLSPKPSVVLATTAPLSPTNTAASTTTLLASSNGTLVVDGTTVTTGMRVLVQNEANGANNGLYVVTNPGSGSAEYVLLRASDMSTGTQVPGAFTFVEGGNTNANSGFVVGGTTPISFTQFSGAGEIGAGTALTKTGNTLAVSVGTTAGTVAAGNDSRFTTVNGGTP